MAMETKPRPKPGGGYFKYPAFVKFEFDDIDDAEFGRAAGMSTQIPFFRSPKILQDRLAYVKANPRVIEEIVWNMVKKYRNFWRDETDEEIYAQLENPVRTVFVILGDGLDHDLARRTFMVEFVACMAPTDTHYDGLLGTDGMGVGSDFDYIDFCEKFRGRLPSAEETPSGLACLEPVKEMYTTLMDQARAAVPNFEEKYAELASEHVVSIWNAHFIMHSNNQDDNGPKYSQETMNDLWPEIGGWFMVVNFLLIFNDVRLSPRVLGSTLFHISRKRTGDICILINAIFGLNRDIRMKQIDSPITNSVKNDGLSLQEASDIAIRKIHALYHDHRLTSQKLLQVFKDEEVKRYVEIVEKYIDGCLFYYTTIERYGNLHQIKIV